MANSLLWIILLLVTSSSFGYAEENKITALQYAKIIYEGGYLMNQGNTPVLNAEIVSPFYRYLGDIKEEEKIDIRDIKTKFTVRYLTAQGLAEYEQHKETFTPVLDGEFQDIDLKIHCSLKDDTLTVKLNSTCEITDIFIEIPQDIPIKISEDRFRYILSSVGVLGQNLQTGKEVAFALACLRRQDFYTVPVKVTFIYKYKLYEKLFLFSFTKDEVKNAAYDTRLYDR